MRAIYEKPVLQSEALFHDCSHPSRSIIGKFLIYSVNIHYQYFCNKYSSWWIRKLHRGDIFCFALLYDFSQSSVFLIPLSPSSTNNRTLYIIKVNAFWNGMKCVLCTLHIISELI